MTAPGATKKYAWPVHTPLRQALRVSIRATVARTTGDARDLPDFLIIGTKRGGTTSMWNYLLAHPLMLPMFPFPRQKSAHFFDVNFARGTRWYRSHFATRRTRARLARERGHATVTGEASPLYLWDPRSASRAASVVPNAKIVVLLRNPVDRAYSHWKERRNEGVEPLSFEDAIEAEPARVDGERARMLADDRYASTAFDWYPYVERGEYADQLDRWYDEYPAEQILVVRSEDMYADPQAAYDRVTTFLGLPRHQLSGYRRFNYTPSPDIDLSTRERLEEHYRSHNERLASRLGPAFTWAADTLP